MAQVTITIPDDKVQRVRDAFTYALDLDAQATVDDVKAYILRDLRQFVLTAERRAAREQLPEIAEVDFS